MYRKLFKKCIRKQTQIVFIKHILDELKISFMQKFNKLTEQH